MKRHLLAVRVIPIAVLVLVVAACSSDRSPQAARAGAEGALYVQRNLVSDGFIPAEHLDQNLVNGWGIAQRPTSPWWVADNETGVSTLYDESGVAKPLVIHVTGAGGMPAAPTGIVANDTTSFVVASGGVSGPALFLFASEDGTISGWNPGVPAPTPSAVSTTTIVMVDNSSPNPLAGAVYKGLAVASLSTGERLYVTNFRAAEVEVYDGAFKRVSNPGAFVDPGIPAGFAPFGIHKLGDLIYVTYAKQDEEKRDDVAGAQLGFVSSFTTDGAFVRRVASQGKLNAPWGLALAPADFGQFSNRLLVGNFGDGHIVGFQLDVNDDAGAYLVGKDGPIVIDGLWGLDFGNGAAAGPTNALFFAAGPGDEQHGLFGRIDLAISADGG